MSRGRPHHERPAPSEATGEVRPAPDGGEKTLANAALYLETFGHTVVAWVWLEQALLAAARDGGSQHDRDFYRGKLQACRYFFQWELPKVQPQLDLLASIDTTTLDMQDAWF